MLLEQHYISHLFLLEKRVIWYEQIRCPIRHLNKTVNLIRIHPSVSIVYIRSSVQIVLDSTSRRATSTKPTSKICHSIHRFLRGISSTKNLSCHPLSSSSDDFDKKKHAKSIHHQNTQISDFLGSRYVQRQLTKNQSFIQDEEKNRIDTIRYIESSEKVAAKFFLYLWQCDIPFLKDSIFYHFCCVLT